MIDLYGMSSPNVAKVMIMLEELGLDYHLNHIAVFRGAQFTREFRAISPFGKVPVIVDRSVDNLTVFESGAILVYLAETYDDGTLLPKSGAARYATLQWLVAQVAVVGPLLGQNNHFLLLPREAESYAAKRYAEQARYLYRVLNDRLASAAWLAGNSYSIADIATYPWALYAPKHGLRWVDFPALKIWCDRMAARPAVARAEAGIRAMHSKDADAMAVATPAELDSFFWREQPGPEADFSVMAR
jgi:GST-like protein